MNVDVAIKTLKDIVIGPGITLAVFYTGDFKQGKGQIVVNNETGEKTKILGFDMILTTPERQSADTLALINVCEKMNTYVVVRSIDGILDDKKVSPHPTYEAWLELQRKRGRLKD